MCLRTRDLKYKEEIFNTIELLLKHKEALINGWFSKAPEERTIRYDYTETFELIPVVDDAGRWGCLEKVYETRDIELLNNMALQTFLEVQLMRYSFLHKETFYTRKDFLHLEDYNYNFFLVEHEGDVYCARSCDLVKEFYMSNELVNDDFWCYLVMDNRKYKEYSVFTYVDDETWYNINLVWEGSLKSLRRAFATGITRPCELNNGKLSKIVYMV